MKCFVCGADNPEGDRFCRKCGNPLELQCPECGAAVFPGDRFCGSCGHPLENGAGSDGDPYRVRSERKQVSVLFSDLSGYSSLAETMDAEELRDMMVRVFGEIVKVVTRYHGFVERIIGDEVMVLFGVPWVHEDDSLRAVRAAREIHETVESMSPRFADKIPRPLAMHSGICSGLVVTGEADVLDGSHGFTGDTVNSASRLARLAERGEILVGRETFRQTEGFFFYESLGPRKVHGKQETLDVYKLLNPKGRTGRIRRTTGLRAGFIGRTAEAALLVDALERLQAGRESIVSVVGEAGTGKSRLIEEFRTVCADRGVHWFEAVAYPYSRIIPYALMAELASSFFGLDRDEPPDAKRSRIEAGLKGLTDNEQEESAAAETFSSLCSPQSRQVNPEAWKSRLAKAAQTALKGLSHRSPTVVCLEDLQWADHPSLEMLRHLFSEFRFPALFLCSYRPPFRLFDDPQSSNLERIHERIDVVDLAPDEAEVMLESLLMSRKIPDELRKFARERAGGNPFFLEEIVNSLMDSGVLVAAEKGWSLTREITGEDIPSTVQGVVSARIDRLGKETRRVLQEAAICGRTFSCEILRRISSQRDQLDLHLDELESLGLIHGTSLNIGPAYVFNHSLTQEVVYNNILRKERQELHERVAQAMEEAFPDRLLELSEALALHYEKAGIAAKAAYYCMKSGEKSMKLHSLEEAHQDFREAYDLLRGLDDPQSEALRLDLLLNWAPVFHRRGEYGEMLDLLQAAEKTASADQTKAGMLQAWIGCALLHRERFREARERLTSAVTIGEERKDPSTIALASTWLVWTLTELGLLDEAVRHGQWAADLTGENGDDSLLRVSARAGQGYASWARGDREAAVRIGNELVESGRRGSDMGSMALGYCCKGLGQLAAGEATAGTMCLGMAVQVAADPRDTQFARLVYCYGLVSAGRGAEAEEHLREIRAFGEKNGAEFISTPSACFLAAGDMANGDVPGGLKMLEATRRRWQENGAALRGLLLTRFLAGVYARIADEMPRGDMRLLMKNARFFFKMAAGAGKKAAAYYRETIDTAQKMGAWGVAGEACREWSGVLARKGNADEAERILLEGRRCSEAAAADRLVPELEESPESRTSEAQRDR